MTRRYRSKTIATWLALVAGSFGLHRFYLYGRRDALAWLHPWPTLLGLAGVQRTLAFGQDDRASWLLMPLLGLMISQAMLGAVIYGLTPDLQWDARHNPGRPARATRWGPVLGVIAALMIGAGVLMATIAFSGQRFFEWQISVAPGRPQPPSAPLGAGARPRGARVHLSRGRRAQPSRTPPRSAPTRGW